MWAWGLVERVASGVLGCGGGGWPWGPPGGRWNASVAVGVTAVAGIAVVAIIVSTRRGGLKSPWWRRRRKAALTSQEWKSLFTPEGKLYDGGVKFLKKVRSGGVDPSIRAEVWPFLLGVYNLDNSEAERNVIKAQNRKGYMMLRKQCLRKSVFTNEGKKQSNETAGVNHAESTSFNEGHESVNPLGLHTVNEGLASEQETPHVNSDQQMHDDASNTNSEKPVGDKISSSSSPEEEGDEKSDVTHVEASKEVNSVLESSVEEDSESIPRYSTSEGNLGQDSELTEAASPKGRAKSSRTSEDFETWQRIIRLDAVRANAEWVSYGPTQAAVLKEEAIESANAVDLKDYDHLEPYRIYHAARLVAVLEAYALYDPEIGYCQGMSDLLAPLLAVLEDNVEAFWCFAGFMRKARHNFRLDEVGIRRQLNMVSKIIKFKDVRLYRHLEKLQAEDCFFVYRMVVVMFRRELTFEQTLCLWEVMWADQAANRGGIGKSAWGKLRLGAPPTDDLLLYAIAASVLQKRKLIIESYSSMDEILRECNSMAGQLDVWKLLDDAHDLVVTLHDRIEYS